MKICKRCKSDNLIDILFTFNKIKMTQCTHCNKMNDSYGNFKRRYGKETISELILKENYEQLKATGGVEIN